jgi:hypothetical protein
MSCAELSLLFGFARSNDKAFMTPLDIGLTCQYLD